MFAGWWMSTVLAVAMADTGDTGLVPDPPTADAPDVGPTDTADPGVVLPPSAASLAGETGGFGCAALGSSTGAGLVLVLTLGTIRGRRP